MYFPENWDKGVLYTIADRYDVKQYRELYASAAAVQAALKEGKPLPSGTVLTLVQYKAQVDAPGQSAEGRQGALPEGRPDRLHRDGEAHRLGHGINGDDIRNGEWEYSDLRRRRQVQRQGQLQGVLPVPQAA